jgi:hypothetical protein
MAAHRDAIMSIVTYQEHQRSQAILALLEAGLHQGPDWVLAVTAGGRGARPGGTHGQLLAGDNEAELFTLLRLASFVSFGIITRTKSGPS